MAQLRPEITMPMFSGMLSHLIQLIISFMQSCHDIDFIKKFIVITDWKMLFPSVHLMAYIITLESIHLFLVFGIYRNHFI